MKLDMKELLDTIKKGSNFRIIDFDYRGFRLTLLKTGFERQELFSSLI